MRRAIVLAGLAATGLPSWAQEPQQLNVVAAGTHVVRDSGRRLPRESD
jgi:hypothetical protein